MSDNEDNSTRIGLWVTFTVVTLLMVSVLTWQVRRALHPAPVDANATRVESLADELMDVPLEGDLAGVVFFDVGSATLPESAQAELAKVLADLQAAPTRKLVIAGFHDASGDPTRNQALARERAIAARNALKAAGADASRLHLRKPEQTLGGSADDARRVEMRLVD